MNKLLVLFSGVQIVDILLGQTAAEIAASYGVTDPSQYQEFLESDFDAACYLYPQAFTLSGGVVGFDLTAAKSLASSQEKFKYFGLESQATTGFSTNQLASQSSLAAVDRLPEIQLVLDAVNTLAVELSANLAAIDAATDINEVNNIVNPPTGILFTGRGGGLGPEDLNVSYYTAFNSASLTEADTELYVPGTAIVIPYLIDIETGNGYFDSMGNCFNPGDYLIQIRQVSDSRVIAEFEVPLNPAGQDVPF
jgi:hypothetical protein